MLGSDSCTSEAWGFTEKQLSNKETYKYIPYLPSLVSLSRSLLVLAPTSSPLATFCPFLCFWLSVVGQSRWRGCGKGCFSQCRSGLAGGWRAVLPEPARAAGSWCRVTSADPGTGSAWQTGGAALDTAAMNSIGTERSWSHLRVIWRAQLWPLRALLVVQESQQS